MRLVFGDGYAALAKMLLSERTESCAILRANPAGIGCRTPRLLVREFHFAPENAYIRRTPVSAELRPDYLAPIVKAARLAGQGLVFVHTHPDATLAPAFSQVDDVGEEALRRFAEYRIPDIPHLALLVSPNGSRCRRLGRGEPVPVVEVSSIMRTVSSTQATVEDAHERFDRQVRAFGRAGQAAISRLHVAIVGLGGTGSVIAQQLALLGVRRITLVDPDLVDETSLNRLVGASARDISLPKVTVAERALLKTFDMEVTPIQADVTEDRVARRLLDADVIFCCTDGHASRAILNQLAYQYFIPVIDMGVVIAGRGGVVTHISGRAQMLSPGLPCLLCARLLDPGAIRREMMSPEQRHADPYFSGTAEPQPAVISLNSTVASLAVTMFLGAVTGIPMSARAQLYDGIRGTTKPFAVTRDPTCIVCSPAGALARGDSWSLPTKGGQSA
jgi:molybdopterin/thiamine biosynthesis adenylyltransferase